VVVEVGERATWEVPVGVVSEERLREMNFFGEGFRAREVVIQKMTGIPPTNFAAISTGVEWEFGSV
jgi:hypothetical protein